MYLLTLIYGVDGSPTIRRDGFSHITYAILPSRSAIKLFLRFRLHTRDRKGTLLVVRIFYFRADIKTNLPQLRLSLPSKLQNNEAFYERDVVFKPDLVNPQTALWIIDFGLDKNTPLDITVTVVKVTDSGMTVRLDKGPECRLNTFYICWLSYEESSRIRTFSKSWKREVIYTSGASLQ